MFERRTTATPMRGRYHVAPMVLLLAAILAAPLSMSAAGAADLYTPGTVPAAPAPVSGGAVNPNQQAAGAPLPIGIDYRIHGGDALNISVFGEPSLSQVTTVLPDGSINYPLVGRVQVAGLSTEAAGNRIAGRLGSFVRKPSVTVAVASPAQYTVLVLGNVKTPGKYLLRSDGHVTDAIAAAGGLGPTNGEFPVAQISQHDQAPQNVSLQRLFRQGDASQNIALSDNAQVYVTAPVSFDVEVVGAVEHPGNISLNQGDHLSMAIARAGNSTNTSADLNHLRVTRLGPDGKPVVYQINLYETLEQGNTKVDIPLQKGDVVYVPQSRHKNGGAFGASGLFLLQHLAGFPYF